MSKSGRTRTRTGKTGPMMLKLATAKYLRATRVEGQFRRYRAHAPENLSSK